MKLLEAGGAVMSVARFVYQGCCEASGYEKSATGKGGQSKHQMSQHVVKGPKGVGYGIWVGSYTWSFRRLVN